MRTMLAEHMELIFAAFPDVLQTYVELRGVDWKPEGVTWTYHPGTGEERVCFTLVKGGRLGRLEQARHFPVNEDGVPIGDARAQEVSFRTE